MPRPIPLLVLLALCATQNAQAAPTTPIIPIHVTVAVESGHPVADDAWVDAAIAEANRLYAVIPLLFRKSAQRPDPKLPAHIETRADRDTAVGTLVPGAVNLRVIASLMDVDEPGRVRRGVHWHLRADRDRHVILLSTIAAPGVLAHELGHFFGNGHSPTDDNLMSYVRTGAEVFLDDRQVSRVREMLRAYLRRRELVALPG